MHCMTLTSSVVMCILNSVFIVPVVNNFMVVCGLMIVYQSCRGMSELRFISFLQP